MCHSSTTIKFVASVVMLNDTLNKCVLCGVSMNVVLLLFDCKSEYMYSLHKFSYYCVFLELNRKEMVKLWT